MAKKKYENYEKDIIVFDIETPLIPKVSKKEKRKEIRKLIPKVVCAYSYQKNEYFFFTEDNIEELFKLFEKSSKIVGFNIIDFDYEVLVKYGLPKGIMEKTIDIFDLIRKETGNWYSLDRLSKENLGRGKKYKGKSLATMEGVSLYEGCKADVQNTKELFDKWEKGELKYDKKRWQRNRYLYDEDWGDPIDYVPFDVCPYCGSDMIEKFDELGEGMGIDGMTEGQLAEYMAGNWGTLYCLKCGRSIDYEM